MLILVIDDDELSRELLTLLLEVEGHQIVPAGSGAEGLERLENGAAPDAILTDLQMPGIAGTELAAALRKAVPRGVPIFAMSGSDSRPKVIEMGIELGTAGAPVGFDGFLLKPFRAADFSAALASVRAETGVAVREEEAGSSNLADLPETDVAAALDEEIFGKMQELMPREQLGQMFALCIADARSRLRTMAASAKAGDEAAYRSAAHAIKGGAGMIGAAELHTLAGLAEGRGLVSPGRGAAQEVSSGTNGVTALIDQLSRALQRLERILVERLRT